MFCISWWLSWRLDLRNQNIQFSWKMYFKYYLAYFWVTNTNIMLEVTYDPFKKNALSLAKKEKPSDFFQGTIWETKPEFMQKFLKGKRSEPDKKERIKDLGQVSGIWNKYVLFNGVEVFNVEQ